MFFPELIKHISHSDRVLEVGPGGTPHPRADVFLEKVFECPDEAEMQRGKAPPLITNKNIIYFNGGEFPIKDKEFDYVICSHVLEHTDNLEYMVSELFRVAKKGYIEYPTIYYEFIYNIPVHSKLIKLKDNNLLYINKSDTILDKFSSIQEHFFYTLGKGYTDLVDDLKSIMFEGFEWSEPFFVKRAKSIDELLWDTSLIQQLENKKRKQDIISILRKILLG